MNFQQSKSPLGIKQSLVLWAKILYHIKSEFRQYKKNRTEVKKI